MHEPFAVRSLHRSYQITGEQTQKPRFYFLSRLMSNSSWLNYGGWCLGGASSSSSSCCHSCGGGDGDPAVLQEVRGRASFSVTNPTWECPHVRVSASPAHVAATRTCIRCNVPVSARRSFQNPSQAPRTLDNACSSISDVLPLRHPRLAARTLHINCPHAVSLLGVSRINYISGLE